ncbi:MAG: hypothetical protein WCT11_04970 [Candidatus Magasanikbacteria bacterium]
MSPLIRELQLNDAEIISSAFEKIKWRPCRQMNPLIHLNNNQKYATIKV